MGDLKKKKPKTEPVVNPVGNDSLAGDDTINQLRDYIKEFAIKQQTKKDKEKQ